MDLADWYILALVCLAGAASPGPSWILLINSVVMHGHKAGIAFSIAHGLGIFLCCISCLWFNDFNFNCPMGFSSFRIYWLVVFTLVGKIDDQK